MGTALFDGGNGLTACKSLGLDFTVYKVDVRTALASHTEH